MKKSGFLSFGHWTPHRNHKHGPPLMCSCSPLTSPWSERLEWMEPTSGFITFAQQLASPFPLLAAVGAKTRKIEMAPQ